MISSSKRRRHWAATMLDIFDVIRSATSSVAFSLARSPFWSRSPSALTAVLKSDIGCAPLGSARKIFLSGSSRGRVRRRLALRSCRSTFVGR